MASSRGTSFGGASFREASFRRALPHGAPPREAPPLVTRPPKYTLTLALTATHLPVASGWEPPQGGPTGCPVWVTHLCSGRGATPEGECRTNGT